MSIRVAADGSALGNPGPAGWAWYVDDNCWGAGGWKHATNNQAELKAVLEFLRATKHLDDDLLILCDSQYVIKCLTEWMPGWKRKGWRKADGKPVLNVDLLKELDDELKGRTYRFEWVKGHANHPLNEAADERARAVSEAYQRGSAIPEGPGWTRDGSSTPSSPRFAKVDGAGSDSTGSADGTDTQGHPTASNAAASATTHTPAATAAPASPIHEQPGLFSFDDEPEAAATHPLTVSLTDDEFARLSARARVTGMSPEDTLRSLI